MTKHIDPLADLRAFDWQRALLRAVEPAAEDMRRGQEMTERDIWWHMLKDAAQVSRIAYSGPPRSGYPVKSAMPDAPKEFTEWQRMAAYLRGELDEMPVTESRPPQPSAAQITQAEMVLRVWHIAALRDKGDWSRIKRAVYLKACGVPDRKIRAVTGLTKQRIHHAKCAAMEDMQIFVRGLLTAGPNRAKSGV